MTSLLDIRPLDPEPLPLYSRHDPDTASIRSAAPSYVSDTPTYRSYRTPTSLLPPLQPGQQTIGLPAPRVYAPGFTPEQRNRGPGSFSKHNLDIGNWSSTRKSNNTKQYSAVARRRTNQARADSLSVPQPPRLERSATTNSLLVSSPRNSTSYPVQPEPANPLEDPYLVGEEAAEEARRARAYREMCARDAETQRHEMASWNFLVGQMRGWEERRMSWGSFESNLPRRSKKRVGWRA